MSKKPHSKRISDWELVGNVKETITLSISTRGDGLCIYLTKDLCDVYGLKAGDMIKITLRDHFRKLPKEKPKDEE